jgi:hypothetical protein
MIFHIFVIILISLNALSEEISQIPENYHSNIKNIAEQKIEVETGTVAMCIKNNKMNEIYQYDLVKELIDTKFNKPAKCDNIIKELESIADVKKQIIDVVNSDICKTNASIENAEQKRKNLEEVYNKASHEYSKFFAYDETLAKFEQCISYYNNAVTFVAIKTEEDNEKSAIKSKRKILEINDLIAFYGENTNATGSDISALIYDLENANITPKEAKKYGIIEKDLYKWELSGAIVGNLIYTSENLHIAIPFVKGKTYSCDKLPHTIFKFEKKIEIPEKDYITYLLEPLE